MKRTLSLVLAGVGVLILACSGVESTDGPETTPAVDPVAADAAPAGLSAPWSGMALPWSGGELITADPTMLLVSWGSTPVSTVSSSYTSTMTGDGWTELALIADADLVVTSYTRESTSLGMMVLSEEGSTFAYFEDLSTIEESAFEEAKAGKRPGTLPGRKGKRGKRGKRGKNR